MGQNSSYSSLPAVKNRLLLQPSNMTLACSARGHVGIVSKHSDDDEPPPKLFIALLFDFLRPVVTSRCFVLHSALHNHMLQLTRQDVEKKERMVDQA